MLDFKPLTLEDKHIFDNYLSPYNFKTCEYSFINLFIWRKGCNIEFTIFENCLIIKKQGFDFKNYFMQPIGYKKENLKKIVDALIEYKDKNSMDFLFKDIENSFLKDINKDNINQCIETAKNWCKKNICEGYLLHELNAIEELLKNSITLNFEGIVVYVNNTLSAFTIGEKINDNMAIIHIEKADSDINGLYTFINKTFIEQKFSSVTFINREQDLGIEGLRKAKLSYQPFKLEPKYIVNIKN